MIYQHQYQQKYFLWFQKLSIKFSFIWKVEICTYSIQFWITWYIIHFVFLSFQFPQKNKSIHLLLHLYLGALLINYIKPVIIKPIINTCTFPFSRLRDTIKLSLLLVSYAGISLYADRVALYLSLYEALQKYKI